MLKLEKNANVLQHAGNSRLRWATSHANELSLDLSSVFNFPCSANRQTFTLDRSISGGYRDKYSNSQADFYSRKIQKVVSLVDSVGYGDRIDWQPYIVKGLSFPPPYFPHTIANRPWPSSYPKYTLGISRRHASRANMVF